jgi:hypothetical protein
MIVGGSFPYCVIERCVCTTAELVVPEAFKFALAGEAQHRDDNPAWQPIPQPVNGAMLLVRYTLSQR